ncbi:DUF6230 family protein [Streptomyces sp. NPDC002838]|uniref:DUF6230 family protein n=1 Tax=Streptomyces sp. NPDC002838 TaxID=3154436 RepID=UPI003330BE1D
MSGEETDEVLAAAVGRQQAVLPCGGRTSRRRLVGALVMTMSVAAVILGCIAEGAVAASFTSGAPFTVTLEHLRAKGFGLQLGVSRSTGKPAVLTRWPDADVRGLCQSSTVDLPVVGRTTMVLTARAAHVTDLVIDAYSASGQLSFTGLAIGPAGEGTGFRSGGAELENITLQAGAATAGTFSITGVELGIRRGDQPCSVPTPAAGASQ